MFVFQKMKDGGRGIRPAYIGFIKNDYLRRTLCIGFSPITFVVAVLYNWTKLFFAIAAQLSGLTCVFVYHFIRGVYVPAKGLLTNWDDIWHEPRKKDDSQ